jgi:hypothetical protein
MMAAEKGHGDVVRCLLDYYADVNMETKVRSTCSATSELFGWIV